MTFILGFLALLGAIFGLLILVWVWGEFCRVGLGDDSKDVHMHEVLALQAARDAHRSPIVGESRSGWAR